MRAALHLMQRNGTPGGGGGEGGRKNRGMTMFGSAKKLSMSFKGKNGNKNSGGGGRGEETLPVVVGGDK